jgi:hypothetical protein
MKPSSEVFVENLIANFIENGRKLIKFTIKFTAELAKNARSADFQSISNLLYRRFLIGRSFGVFVCPVCIVFRQVT